MYDKYKSNPIINSKITKIILYSHVSLFARTLGRVRVRVGAKQKPQNGPKTKWFFNPVTGKKKKHADFCVFVPVSQTVKTLN